MNFYPGFPTYLYEKYSCTSLGSSLAIYLSSFNLFLSASSSLIFLPASKGLSKAIIHWRRYIWEGSLMKQLWELEYPRALILCWSIISLFRKEPISRMMLFWILLSTSGVRISYWCLTQTSISKWPLSLWYFAALFCQQKATWFPKRETPLRCLGFSCNMFRP